MHGINVGRRCCSHEAKPYWPGNFRLSFFPFSQAFSVTIEEGYHSFQWSHVHIECLPFDSQYTRSHRNILSRRESIEFVATLPAFKYARKCAESRRAYQRRYIGLKQPQLSPLIIGGPAISIHLVMQAGSHDVFKILWSYQSFPKLDWRPVNNDQQCAGCMREPIRTAFIKPASLNLLNRPILWGWLIGFQ